MVKSGETAKTSKQGGPAVQPGCCHHQYGGAQVICDGETSGAEQVKTKEVGALARDMEGERRKSPGAVAHSEIDSAHHANLSMPIALQLFRSRLNRQPREPPANSGLIENRPGGCRV